MTIRIYELAKELHIDSKILMAICGELDIYLKNHMTQLDDECEELVREAYGKPHPLVAAHLEKQKVAEEKKHQLENQKLEREKKKLDAEQKKKEKDDLKRQKDEERARLQAEKETTKTAKPSRRKKSEGTPDQETVGVPASACPSAAPAPDAPSTPETAFPLAAASPVAEIPASLSPASSAPDSSSSPTTPAPAKESSPSSTMNTPSAVAAQDKTSVLEPPPVILSPSPATTIADRAPSSASPPAPSASPPATPAKSVPFEDLDLPKLRLIRPAPSKGRSSSASSPAASGTGANLAKTPPPSRISRFASYSAAAALKSKGDKKEPVEAAPKGGVTPPTIAPLQDSLRGQVLKSKLSGAERVEVEKTSFLKIEKGEEAQDYSSNRFVKDDGKKKFGLRRFQKIIVKEKKGGQTEIWRKTASLKKDDRSPLPEAKEKKIDIRLPITIKDFSQATGIKTSAILGYLMKNGVLATINHQLDEDTIHLLGMEHGLDLAVSRTTGAEEKWLEQPQQVEDRSEDLTPRPCTIAFLGHVDHGKTSLQDALRQTDVAASEDGGITQHLGASTITTAQGRVVTMIDTPGHAAFTAMRARGAQATDIVILVVAADDGVMPQTEEAINHAKAAKVPILVALNKIDKPEANPLKAKQQLAALGLNPEEWGGETQIVEVSATTKRGLPDLLEKILLEADLLELKANPSRLAHGIILESRLTQGKGVVATALVKNGTLRPGDAILCGKSYGKVRQLMDDKRRQAKEIGPGLPCEITGLSEVPEAGSPFTILDTLEKARDIVSEREVKERTGLTSERKHVSLDNLFSTIAEGKAKDTRVVVKADVKGSADVLVKALGELSHKEVALRIIHSGVGNITESDVLLADASDAIIIGFRVEADAAARNQAEARGVEIRHHRIIYELLDELKQAMLGKLAPEKKEVVLGHATVRALFKISRLGTIAGCFVTDGKIERNGTARILRDGKVLFTGGLESLKHVKDDVRSVPKGQECGIKLAKFDDILADDVIEIFEIQTVYRTVAEKA